MILMITGSDATTSVSTLPITTTGHGSSTTTNSDISVTTSHLVMTESTTDNNIMPQATNNDVTENDTIFIVTLPPTVTVQITTVIVAVLVTTAVAILVIVVTIMVICLNYRCKKKTHHILVNTLPDEPLHQSHQNEGAHFNACNPINESEEQTNSDQRCHLNHDNIEAGDQVHDLSAANFKTEVRYEQVKLNRNQHYNMMALTLKKEEIEAGYEQVPAENRSNKKELQSDSSLPLDHQYAIPTGGTETVGTTTVEQQQQGGNTRYDTIATYQKAAVYERATTYQKVATYERAVTYEKVPMTTHTMID